MCILSEKIDPRIVIGLLGLFIFAAAGSVQAQGKNVDFDYDIFLTSDTVAVWLDITPVLTQPKMEDLLAGLDLSIIIDLRLEQPRKLFLSKTLVNARAAVLITHRLTEDTYRLRLVNAGTGNYEFQSQLELSDFLSDSLILRVVPKSLIETETDIRLRLKIVSKSHTSNVLDEIPGHSGRDLEAGEEPEEEFFESLFSFFLDLIGFGKTSYQIVSPPFSLDDLTSL